MGRRILALACGRRSKWVVLAAWVVVMVLVSGPASKFEDVQKNEPSSFLPGSAESLKTNELSKGFRSGEQLTAIVVFRRDSGLTAADRARIAGVRAQLNAKPPKTATPAPPPVISRDRTTALLAMQVRPHGESELLTDAADRIKDVSDQAAKDGLQVKLTGPLGFSADAVDVFNQINGTLLLATLALVFVLLIVIYRSPIFWIIPFVSVVFAELCSRGLGYALAEAGVTVNGQSAGILPVLVFGAGTDYALLIVARYREELRRHEDKHEAMALGMRRAGPAIVASGLTVIAGLLCLTIAEVNGTSGMGPICAMGIALAMVSMLTLLPALLTIGGRRAFWPFVPRFGGAGADETHGTWRRIGERVATRPRPIWIGSIAALVVLALGSLQVDTGLTSGNQFRGSVDSVEGQKLVSDAFPAGANAPTEIIVRDRADVPAVRAALARTPGVVALGPVELGPPGARFDTILRPDPYSPEAFDLVPDVRRSVRGAADGAVLVGGPTAEARDLRVASARDNRVIVPLALVVVFLILTGLLRAVVAPLILIGTVILSFAAALGVGIFFFNNVFDFPGIDPSLPLFAFVFLVALGVDYNIFLMARVREEALSWGTRQGMIRGLAVTGGVITSAGIVLAGTFSTLAILPLVFLTELGFVIAFGVLLDTLLVRSVLVPALVFELGPRIWLPSTLGHAIDRRGPLDVDRLAEAAGDGDGARERPTEPVSPRQE
jgi:RND superfamily putative drug exporter